jgi:hypothetical protein
VGERRDLSMAALRGIGPIEARYGEIARAIDLAVSAGNAGSAL